MAVTSMDTLVAALPGQLCPVYKTGFSPQAAGAWTSLWLAAGLPGPGVAPSSGVAGDVPTSATAGAIPFTNPTSPALSYLGGISLTGTVVGTLLLYDRLWQNSGLSATSTSAQTVNSVALTRPDALGGGAELWLDVYAVMGAGTPAITASYTNQAGTSGKTATLTPAITSASSASRSYPFALASGDTGVRSVQSYTANATMTSGTFGLVLRRRLLTIPLMQVELACVLDAITGGMPQVNDSACLELLWLATSTSSPTAAAPFAIVQG